MVDRVGVEAKPLRGLEERSDCLASVFQVLGPFVEGDVGTRYWLLSLLRTHGGALELLQRLHDLQKVEVGPELLLWVLLHGLAEYLCLCEFWTSFPDHHYEIPAICAICSSDRRTRSLIAVLEACSG